MSRKPQLRPTASEPLPSGGVLLHRPARPERVGVPGPLGGARPFRIVIEGILPPQGAPALSALLIQGDPQAGSISALEAEAIAHRVHFLPPLSALHSLEPSKAERLSSPEPSAAERPHSGAGATPDAPQPGAERSGATSPELARESAVPAKEASG